MLSVIRRNLAVFGRDLGCEPNDPHASAAQLQGMGSVSRGSRVGRHELPCVEHAGSMGTLQRGASAASAIKPRKLEKSEALGTLRWADSASEVFVEK